MTIRAASIESVREPVVGVCSQCGATELARYEVLSEGGWHRVLKCQSCLASLEREPWSPLGHVDRLGVTP
jgi:hypothetical protein